MKGKLPSTRAGRLLAALGKLGFAVARQRGSHRFLRHADGRTLVFGFHDKETVGPKMLARIAKDHGISPEALQELL